MDNLSDEEEIAITENEAMREKSLEQLREAVAMMPQEERAGLEEAQQKAPNLVEKESNPIRFLRFHSFNAWAAAKRLASYWSFRTKIFGYRAFLPLNLSGEGAIPLDDVNLLLSGAYMFLSNDQSGRSVLYMDRSKLSENEKLSTRILFFIYQQVMDNEVSGKLGCTVLINLSNPFGATFQPDNVALCKDLVRKAMLIKVARIHVVCTPPVQGRTSFVSSIVPVCLQRMGPFFSKYAEVHVADTEQAVLEKLQEHGLTREGLPPFFGGTWNGFDDWLAAQQCSIDRNLRVDALVRNTLWAYTERVGSKAATRQESSSSISGSGDESSSQESRELMAAEESLIQDRKAYAHFDIRDYTTQQQRGTSPEEREAILRDIYGTTNVNFTVTKEVEMEGRARKQLDEAIEMLPDQAKKDYLEAKEAVPHLVEIESDPSRYLRVENFNAWNAASRVCLYWKNRREVFGDRAFLPLTLCGNSALTEEEKAMLKTGYMTMMPEDDQGRPIYFMDLSRLTGPFSPESRTRCSFYICQVISERESSRNAGVIGMAAYTKKAPKGATNAKNGTKATEMARDGVFPCHWRAIHVCAVGVRSNTLRDNYFVPYTLQMLRRWKALSLRTLVHVDQTPEGIRSKIAKYGVPPKCVPTTVGGTWTYEKDFSDWISQRVEYEKETYWSDETLKTPPQDLKLPASPEPPKKVDSEVIQRDKKRKMDALYARRKRERQRIEIEVLQEQCVEFQNKNSFLLKQNKFFEGLLRNANAIVQLHENGSLNADAAIFSAGQNLCGHLIRHKEPVGRSGYFHLG